MRIISASIMQQHKDNRNMTEECGPIVLLPSIPFAHKFPQAQ